METIKNIFDRTRLCEGLAIPRTVGVFGERTGLNKEIMKEIILGLERSGVSRVYSNTEFETMVNPFMTFRSYNMNSPAGETQYHKAAQAEDFDVLIWLSENYASDVCEAFADVRDKTALNIVISTNRIGMFYGKPLPGYQEVRNKFTKGNSFGFTSSDLPNGASPGRMHRFRLALLAVYFAVSEAVSEKVSASENGFVYNLGRFYEAP